MRGQNKIKRVLVTVLAMAVATTSFFVGDANAKTVRTEPLWIDDDTASSSNTDEGWAWDADTKTLTLDNFEAVINTTTTDSLNYAVIVPENSKIVLKGANSIKNTNDYGSGVLGVCDLDIRGENGASIDFNVWRFTFTEYCKNASSNVSIKDLTITQKVKSYYMIDAYNYTTEDVTEAYDNTFTMDNVNVTSSSDDNAFVAIYPDNYADGRNVIKILNSNIQIVGNKYGEIDLASINKADVQVENTTIDIEKGYFGTNTIGDNSVLFKNSSLIIGEGIMDVGNYISSDDQRNMHGASLTLDNTKVKVRQSTDNNAAIYVGQHGVSKNATFNILNGSDVDAEIAYSGWGNKAAIQIERDGGPHNNEGEFVLNIKDSKVRAVNSMVDHANAGITLEHQNSAVINIDNSEVYASGVTGIYATASDGGGYAMNNAEIIINNSDVTAIGTGAAEESTGYGAAIVAGAKNSTTNIRVNNSKLKLVSNNYNGINALGDNKEISIVNSEVDYEGVAGELAAILGASETARSFIELDAEPDEKDTIDEYIAENGIELQTDALFRALTTFDGRTVNNDAEDDFILKYPTGINKDNAAECAIKITHFFVDDSGAITDHEEIDYEATDEGMLVHSKMGYFVIAYTIPPEVEPVEPDNPATVDGILSVVGAFVALALAAVMLTKKYMKR